MEHFIELHIKGEKKLINLRWVEEIHVNEAGIVTIFFAFSVPDGIEQDYMDVDESYNEILNKIWR